jgi:hypothetical protein
MTTVKEAIIEAMMSAILIDAWADTPEGEATTGSLRAALPMAPNSTYREAYARALIYYGRIWQLWSVEPANQVAKQAEYLGRDPVEYGDSWGFCCAMESLGRQVRWTDTEDPVAFAVGTSVEEEQEHPGEEIELEDDLEWEVDWLECPQCEGEMYGLVNELSNGDSVVCEDCGEEGEVLQEGDGEFTVLVGA